MAKTVGKMLLTPSSTGAHLLDSTECLEVSEERASIDFRHAAVHAGGVLAARGGRILATLSTAIGDPAEAGTLDMLAAAFQSQRSNVSALIELVVRRSIDGEYRVAEIKSGAETTGALGCVDGKLIGLENPGGRPVALIEGAVGSWTTEYVAMLLPVLSVAGVVVGVAARGA